MFSFLSHTFLFRYLTQFYDLNFFLIFFLNPRFSRLFAFFLEVNFYVWIVISIFFNFKMRNDAFGIQTFFSWKLFHASAKNWFFVFHKFRLTDCFSSTEASGFLFKFNVHSIIYYLYFILLWECNDKRNVCPSHRYYFDF